MFIDVGGVVSIRALSVVLFPLFGLISYFPAAASPPSPDCGDGRSSLKYPSQLPIEHALSLQHVNETSTAKDINP